MRSRFARVEALRRWWWLVGAVLVASTSVACGAPSAKPLVRLLSAAPTPSAGVRVVAESTDGTVEIGARARLVYAVPGPLSQACTQLIAQYTTARYTVTTSTGYLPDDEVVPDVRAYCARTSTGDAVPHLLYRLRAAGEETRPGPRVLRPAAPSRRH